MIKMVIISLWLILLYGKVVKIIRLFPRYSCVSKFKVIIKLLVNWVKQAVVNNLDFPPALNIVIIIKHQLVRIRVVGWGVIIVEHIVIIVVLSQTREVNLLLSLLQIFRSLNEPEPAGLLSLFFISVRYHEILWRLGQLFILVVSILIQVRIW